MTDNKLLFTTQDDVTIYLPAVVMVGAAKGLPPKYSVQGNGNLAVTISGYGKDERSAFVAAWKAALTQ